ncbi:pilin [Psychrobacter pygoscelis]|uniref:pilin n=1 Tax=Psychrobacter pygoscelis TaxID=2488563 RepID=UPI00103F361B|nr:pilin [Psychrobacter pygoscelis]
MNAQKGFTLIELMIVIAIIGILAAIAIPQYQTYIAKSQVSRVMGETGNLKTAVEDCYNSGRTGSIIFTGDPTTNTECSLGATASNMLGAAVTTTAQTGFPQVTMNSDDNTASIVGTFGQNASGAIAGQTLTWSRNASGSWSCSTTVEAKFAPNGCPATTTTTTPAEPAAGAQE